MDDRKNHWEKIYQTKPLSELSWYEPVPETSLSIIAGLKLPKDAAIIDIGGGDSLLADHLLKLGYTNITVLDISTSAIERAKQRLNEKAVLVNWLVSDMLSLDSALKYDLWHDRAAFHFLTDEKDQRTYLKTVKRTLTPGAFLIIGTFAIDGPEKCSGLNIQRYSEQSLSELFSAGFNKLECFSKLHLTPFKTVQSFIFCIFQNI